MSDAWKIEYLAHALSSRTRNKDLENYVVNAIWNRVADWGLKPVTQQFVRTKDGGRFIDLYFPQIGVAVECDEWYHSDENQTLRDDARAQSVFDALRSVSEEELEDGIQRIRRAEAVTHEDFEAKIDDVVALIKRRAADVRNRGKFRPWTEQRPDPSKYFAHRDHIDFDEVTLDDVGFGTIAEGHRALFGAGWGDRSTQNRSAVPLAKYHNKAYGDLGIAFLGLNVVGGRGSGGWHNEMSRDGLEIREYQRGCGAGDFAEKRQGVRVWFVKDLKPVRSSGKPLFRFAGIFEDQSTTQDYRYWKRVGKKLVLLKNGINYDEIPERLWAE